MNYTSVPFDQDIGVKYTSPVVVDAHCIAVSSGVVWVGVANGVAKIDRNDTSFTGLAGAPVKLASDGEGGVYAATSRGFERVGKDRIVEPLTGLGSDPERWVERARGGGVWCVSAKRLVRWDGKIVVDAAAPEGMELDYASETKDGRLFVGARLLRGAYSSGERGVETSYVRQLLTLENGKLVTRNAIKNSRGRSVSDELLCMAADGAGSVWIGTPDGLTMTDGAGYWIGFDGRDGLPFNATQAITVGTDGDIWTATPEGACRLRNGRWSYFWGRRWMPGNNVRDIAIDAKGDAWLATDGGVAHIESRKTTLEAKAKHYEEITAARHNRSGWVTIGTLANAPEPKLVAHEASDNDGLWTAVYAAGECFRYAVTKEPEARALAAKSMRAIMDLERLSGISGYPARALIKDGEQNVQRSTGHWHRSTVDPTWQWKGDTSSDELDGHYFIYPIYYDLVANDAEKRELRAAIRRITDHLLTHNYKLIDIDGKPTRWAIYDPEDLNDNPAWEEGRGLNSLSMLSYLKVAFHMTGDEKYQRAYEDLAFKHHYLLNTLYLKQLPPYSINHSDDQLTFLGYYSLLSYENDPAIRRLLLMSLDRTWRIVRPERSSLFNLIYGALSGRPCDARQAVETLEQWPWDLRHWLIKNSQRTDIRIGENSEPGTLESTVVLPHSERRVMQWSDNPYQLDAGDPDGTREYDGAAFLLPYWLGRCYKLIPE